MKLKIEIELDNSAFDPDIEIEVAEILKKVSSRFLMDANNKTIANSEALYDSNGNTVGFFEVRE